MALNHPKGGQRLGPWEVLGEIARGGQGAVLRARDPASGREVALKLLLRADEKSERRFRQEAQVLERLDHPGIVRVRGHGVEDRVPWLAMDLVVGETLGQRVERAGVLDPGEAASIVARIARAVAHAHERGIVHRDLKPENVIVDRASGQPVLVDFGLLRRDAEVFGELSIDARSRLSRTGELRGTPAFMAPEQVSPARFGPVGPLTDVYGLGGVLFFLLTGAVPVEADSLPGVIFQLLESPDTPDPAAKRPGLPANVRAEVRRALSRAPADRHPSALALAEALELVAGGGRASPSGSTGLAAALAVALLLVVAGGVALGAWVGRAETSDASPATPASARDGPVQVSDAPGSAPSPSPAPSPAPAPASTPRRARDWRRVAASDVGPRARNGLEGGLAWDDRQRALLLFGGCVIQVDAAGKPVPSLSLRDTWAWDGRAWSLLGADLGPGARFGQGMGRDASGRALLVSGTTGNGEHADPAVWRWTGRAWSAIPSSTQGEAPPPRYWLATTSSAARGSMFLFGGRGPAGPGGDDSVLWEFDGGRERWTAHRSERAPPFRCSSAIAWDEARGVLVVFGGSATAGGRLGDTWTWHPADGWTDRGVAGPGPRNSHGLVWDGERCVLFGGTNGRALDDTWTWDGARWEPLETRTRPTPRRRFGAGWDPVRRALVVFGGCGPVSPGTSDVDLRDTWELGE